MENRNAPISIATHQSYFFVDSIGVGSFNFEKRKKRRERKQCLDTSSHRQLGKVCLRDCWHPLCLWPPEITRLRCFFQTWRVLITAKRCMRRITDRSMYFKGSLLPCFSAPTLCLSFFVDGTGGVGVFQVCLKMGRGGRLGSD